MFWLYHYVKGTGLSLKGCLPSWPRMLIFAAIHYKMQDSQTLSVNIISLLLTFLENYILNTNKWKTIKRVSYTKRKDKHKHTHYNK